MPDQEASPPANDARTVTGKRVAFWKGISAGALILELGSPLLLLASGLYAYQVARGDMPLWDFDSLVFLILAILGIVGLRWLFGERRSIVLDSACPCCGFRTVRDFGDSADPERFPVRCGRCIAYLRAEGVEVREEDSDAVSEIPLYSIEAARLLPAARPDPEGHFQFEMPRVCVVCGSDASGGRDVFRERSDFGVVGSVVGEAVEQERPSTKYTRDGSSSIDQELGFSGMRVPVCARHASAASFTERGAEYTGTSLDVQSYRFYKQFLALNHIDGPAGQVTAEPQPQPASRPG